MDGQPIAARAVAEADLRALPTERGGPRPGGVRGDSLKRTEDGRTARATKP